MKRRKVSANCDIEEHCAPVIKRDGQDKLVVTSKQVSNCFQDPSNDKCAADNQQVKQDSKSEANCADW